MCQRKIEDILTTTITTKIHAFEKQKQKHNHKISETDRMFDPTTNNSSSSGDTGTDRLYPVTRIKKK